MPEHADYECDIPEWAASRLEGEALVRLEHHFTECPACAGLAASARGIARALERDGEALLAEHPSPAEIARLADFRLKGEEVPPHILLCETCALEVGALHRRSAERRAGSRRRILRWALPAATMAAGLLMGLLLPPPRVDPGGAPPSVWLTVLRSGEAAPSLRITGEDANVLLLAAVDVPREEIPAGGLIAEIIGPLGSSVWSLHVPRSRLIESLENAESILLAVPAASLEEGRHDLLLRHDPRTPAAEVLRLSFQVVRSR